MRKRSKSFDARWAVRIFQDNQKTRVSQPARAKSTLALLIAIVSLVGPGCATATRAYRPQEAQNALNAQAALVKTVRGRAWIKARGPEQKISFPAIVVVDRTDKTAPRLRIEAIDPFGTVHSLMILDRSQKFTWIDFDQRQIYRMHATWNGLPLAKLPELVLGLATATEQPSHIEYDMKWIDPGPRLALSGLTGLIKTKTNASERYVVQYSKFLDKDDYYLPEDVVIKGYSGGVVTDAPPDVELSIAWRERSWNEPVPPELFVVPATAVKGFQNR